MTCIFNKQMPFTGANIARLRLCALLIMSFAWWFLHFKRLFIESNYSNYWFDFVPHTIWSKPHQLPRAFLFILGCLILRKDSFESLLLMRKWNWLLMLKKLLLWNFWPTSVLASVLVIAHPHVNENSVENWILLRFRLGLVLLWLRFRSCTPSQMSNSVLNACIWFVQSQPTWHDGALCERTICLDLNHFVYKASACACLDTYYPFIFWHERIV